MRRYFKNFNTKVLVWHNINFMCVSYVPDVADVVCNQGSLANNSLLLQV